MPHVLVIGAGIVGLSTAVLLAKAGHRVTIWTKERCPNTTSNKAGAFWYPAYGGENEDPQRLVRWCIRTYDYIKTHLADKLEAGVLKLPAYLFYDEVRTEPIWKVECVSMHGLNILANKLRTRPASAGLEERTQRNSRLATMTDSVLKRTR